MTVLLLKLAAPLQAWGSSSRFARRSTEREPTKSGVLGLLAAAQGRRRTDSIEDLLTLRFGVRVDQEGSLVQDFQTARTMVGKVESMPLTRRFYLSDAVFVAGVEGPTELIEALDAAVRAPRFPLYLGRRSCPPAGPASLGIRETALETALRDEPWQASSWYRNDNRAGASLRIVIDAEPGQTSRTQRDAPVSFNPRLRSYGWRSVREAEPKLVGRPGGDPDFFGTVRG